MAWKNIQWIVLSLAAAIIIFSSKLVQSEINVSIDFNVREVVESVGTSEKLISDAEKIPFHITDGDLKTYIFGMHKSSPTDVYVRSPTPWGDLYNTYKWKQITRTVRMHEIYLNRDHPNVEIVDLISNKCENRPHNVVVCKFKSIMTTGTVTHTRQSPDQWNLGGQVNYKFVADPTGLPESLFTMQYQPESWQGTHVQKFSAQTIRQPITVKMQRILKPEEKATAKLLAIKYIMKAKLKYKAYLKGDVAVNYEKKHEGHYFWSYDIASLLTSQNPSALEASTEERIIGEFILPYMIQIFAPNSTKIRNDLYI